MEGRITHLSYMKRALRLARKGHGRVSPNPLVGAVVVNGGRIVGEGYHLFSRRDHAEAVALRQAGDSARGGDLYVTLEPCTHLGRTPPCVEAIVRAGIERVFVAVEDPNPLVSGKGIAYLRDRNLEVEVGLCEEEARAENRFFFHFMRTGKPYVRLKLALTLDGRIATCTGESKWITGPKARRLGHRLRFDSDAILVGINTVLQDDPSLDVRWSRRKSITKVILDSRLRLSPESLIFESADPVWVFHSAEVDSRRRRLLAGCAELIETPPGPGGLNWDYILEELGRRTITSVLVEGGGSVATSCLQSDSVQEFCLFYGPCLIGDSGLPSFGDLGVVQMKTVHRLQLRGVRQLDQDLFLEAVPLAPELKRRSPLRQRQPAEET